MGLDRALKEVLEELRLETELELEKYGDISLETILEAHREEACKRIDNVAEKFFRNAAARLAERVKDEKKLAMMLIALKRTLEEVVRDIKKELGCVT